MKRTRLTRKTPLRSGKGPGRTPMSRRRKPMKGSRTPIRSYNPERRRRLREAQFGTDGYREKILATPCLVRGTLPVDPAHVLKTRAAGGGPEGLAPLSREVHRAFDSMGAARFAEVYGVSKADIRAWARERRERWEGGS